MLGSNTEGFFFNIFLHALTVTWQRIQTNFQIRDFSLNKIASNDLSYEFQKKQ